MTFKKLQDELRAHISARIRRGELTGSGLARDAGFPQGHLSNFLHARRGLSLESMDRLLDKLGIGALDLVSAEEIRRRTVHAASQNRLEQVPLIAAARAMSPRIRPEDVSQMHNFRRAFLRRLKTRPELDRRDWLRFVLVRLNPDSARAIVPFSSAGVTVLLDRHYTSLEPHRRLQPNLYLVNISGRCAAGTVSIHGDEVIVRPRDPEQPLEAVAIERGRRYSDYIAGRICHIALEV